MTPLADADSRRQRRSLELHVRDGLRMSVDSWEAGGGPTCLLIHGFGDGAHVWDAVVGRLQNAGRCLAPDLLGHGDSAHDHEGRYGIGDHAADVAALCSSMALREVVLVGHSLGGAVAIHLAAGRRVSVAGLVLVDCGPQSDEDRSALIEQASLADRPYRSVDEYRGLLGRLQPLGDLDALDMVASRSLRQTASGLFVLKRDGAMELDARVLQPADRSPVWSALATVDCPVLVVRGAASALLTASAAERMRRMGDDVRLETIPAAGHAVMTDNPGAVAHAIDGFLDDTCAT